MSLPSRQSGDDPPLRPARAERHTKRRPPRALRSPSIRHRDPALDILDAHGPRLFATLARLTLREHVAEDLMQDLALKLADSDAFAAARNPAAYAHRVAVNLALDWRRRQRNEPAQLSTHTPAPGSSALAALIRDEQLAAVLDALEELDEPGRSVIVMRHLDGLTYEQIGQALGRTAHHARALAHRALTRLRQILTPELQEPPR